SSVHSKKLSKLSPDFSVERLSPDEVILNLSSMTLSTEEKTALMFGLNYTLSTGDLSDLDFNTSLELTARKLKHCVHDDASWLEIKSLLLSSRAQRNCSPPTRSDKRNASILRALGKNESIFVSRPDKGNGVVILNRSDYVLKMSDLLSDSSKFVPITDDCYKLCQRLENRLNKTLLSLFKAGKLDKPTYDSLQSSGSYPGKLYGLPKTHKIGVPLRPILSAVTCHNYRLA